MPRDFQHCGILTSVDSDELPIEPQLYQVIEFSHTKVVVGLN